MRNHLRLPTLAFLVMLVATACSGGTPATAAPSTGGEASAPAAESPSSAPAESPSGEAAVPTPEPAADCAQSTADNAMEMWERSGGNKGMVDLLVCGWNEQNPDKPINLSYIPHTEMVDKIARGIATGDVPDLMGMDLIYPPQFENAGQLVDITDQISSWPELDTASPGHMAGGAFHDRLV